MDFENMQEEERNQKYNEYVEQVTPKHSCLKNSIHAFITGGIICTLGQFLINVFMKFGLDIKSAGMWETIVLVALSVILTCLNIFPSIVKWGGAGALVPITGFANGVCAPAMEFKKEGWVYGVGARIFQIAGPVILYGTVTSFVLGIIYWAGKLLYLW